jgi:hypothetical protein
MKGTEAVSTISTTAALYIPNTILGGSSEIRGISEDLGSLAGNDGTTQLSRSLPDNLSEVRGLIKE